MILSKEVVSNISKNLQVDYNDALKSYHNSPAYQNWISLKAKGDLSQSFKQKLMIFFSLFSTKGGT